MKPGCDCIFIAHRFVSQGPPAILKSSTAKPRAVSYPVDMDGYGGILQKSR